MSRTILDDDLRRWEVFATTGDFGFSDGARVVFRCASDARERPRARVLEGDKPDAERLVVEGSEAELKALLGEAAPLD